jgi:hypothetical protein
MDQRRRLAALAILAAGLGGPPPHSLAARIASAAMSAQSRRNVRTGQIDLIRDMAARGRLWGAERIRGELLKLGIKVSKRTIPS